MILLWEGIVKGTLPLGNWVCAAARREGFVRMRGRLGACDKNKGGNGLATVEEAAQRGRAATLTTSRADLNHDMFEWLARRWKVVIQPRDNFSYAMKQLQHTSAAAWVLSWIAPRPSKHPYVNKPFDN